MTRSQFIKKAETAFARANPNANLTIIWRRAPRLVTYPTGITEWAGYFHAYSNQHRPRKMLAQGDDSYIMIR